MDERYLIIVPITGNYFPEGEALLRSLQVHNPQVPVDVISVDGQADHLKAKHPNVRQVINWERDNTKQNAEFRQVRTSRFQHAADVSSEFTAVMILDADMLCCRSLNPLFQMAVGGTILVGSNNTLLRYVHKDFVAMQEDAPEDINVISGSFCTVPTVLNPKIHYEFLTRIYASPTGNDLDIPNLLVHTLDLYKEHVFHLPSYITTGIHHTFLKPEVGVKETDQGLHSEMGEPIFLLHGHFGSDAYCAELLSPMEKHYGWHRPYIDQAVNKIAALRKEYMKYYIPPTTEA